MYGSLLGCSLESFVLDNDMIGAVMRATRGFEVSEETLSLESIRDVCVGGPGHFLGVDGLLNQGGTLAAVGFGPVDADPATLGHLALPLAAVFE